MPPQGRATQYLSTFIGPKRGSELARTRLLARLCRLEAAPAHAPPQADHGLRGVQRVQGAWHGPGHRAGLDAAGAPRGVSRWRSMDQSIAVPRGDWCHAEIPARRRSELTRSFLRQSAATEEWPVHQWLRDRLQVLLGDDGSRDATQPAEAQPRYCRDVVEMLLRCCRDTTES